MNAQSVCLLGLFITVMMQPLRAQGPLVDVGLSYATVTYRSTDVESFASLSSSIRIWSRGPLSLTGEVSASARLPKRIELAGCPDVLGYVCDSRRIGDVIRAGLTSRLGKRDGAGPYAIASAGWWGTQRSGDVTKDGRVIASSSGERIGGIALGLGAGSALPIGDRRTGIEARWMRLGGIQDGGIVQLSLTRRW